MFNALDVMENLSFLEDLKFGIGDGNLHYYFYNWKCPEVTPDKVSSCNTLIVLPTTVEPLYCGHLGDLVKCPA